LLIDFGFCQGATKEHISTGSSAVCVAGEEKRCRFWRTDRSFKLHPTGADSHIVVSMTLLQHLARIVIALITLPAFAAEMRIGIIGLDTSHVPAFTKLINDPSAPNHVPGGKVVAAVKTSSADIPASADRVEQYTAGFAEELWRQTSRNRFRNCVARSIASSSKVLMGDRISSRRAP
jgi:hypothetical protein